MFNLDTPINMNTYNNLLQLKGGSPIITKKKLLTMKAFISVLLKLFRKDYESKLRNIKGGYYDSDLGIYNSALKMGELNYSNQYMVPPIAQLEREVY